MVLSASRDVIPRSRTTQCGTHIDEDIAALAKSLRACISWLPPEILATIFIYIAEEDSASFTDMCHPYGAPACLVVTHVCRHWRQVALDCPTLWALIDGVSRRWLVIMLERSKKAPLIVIYCDPDSLRNCSEQLLSQVLSQLPRIKFLHLRPSPPAVNRILDCLSSQPAPLLQTFKFSIFGFADSDTVRPISDAIFQGRAPQLRNVRLVQCFYSWTSCIFSGLRTLDMVSNPDRSPLSRVLAALRLMPDLELFEIDLLPPSPEDTPLIEKVPLTRLRRIALHTQTIRTAISLFSHLALPIDIKIALNCTEIEHPHSFSELFSAMDLNPDESVPVIRSLRANFVCGFFALRFSISMAPNPDLSWIPRGDDIIDIPLAIKFFSWATEPDIVFDICRMVPHRQIQKLFASFPELYPPESFWRTGSADLPELDSIHLNDTPIRGLLAALYIGDEQSSDIAYPSLRALELENIDFGCDEPGYLQTILMMRAERGVGINTLRLAKCTNLTSDEVQLLQDVVADVDWDMYEKVLRRADGGCLCSICSDENSETGSDEDSGSYEDAGSHSDADLHSND